MVRIGDLDKRIDIQAPTRVSDGMFGFTETFSSIATSIPAAIWPISAQETIKAGEMTNIITHRVRMRYRANMKANYRLVYGTRYFNIVSIINVGEKNRWTEMLVKEAG
jgi:SPP1 family predicted phage head-tail adaptor